MSVYGFNERIFYYAADTSQYEITNVDLTTVAFVVMIIKCTFEKAR